MNTLWIFFILVIFCIYVLLGLYITENIDTTVQLILTWVIYTILCTTFLNVFILGYFWSVIREKKGPTGIRGQSGENGKLGLQGICGIDASEAYFIKALNDYIDGLYHSKTNKHIVDETTQKFPCKYLNNKILTMAGSRQYKAIIANMAKENKPIIYIINYLKSIWKQWFDLLYNATEEQGVWFTDKYADEEYAWSQNHNPFTEIRKYDIYYWGITRDFRPLKAEICRSTPLYESAKLPVPNQKKEPRIKIIQSNDYFRIGDSVNDDGNGMVAWWRPNVVSIGSETYYPVGDVLSTGDIYENKDGKTITGDIQYDTIKDGYHGPDMKTILVTGDVVDPIKYNKNADTAVYDAVNIFNPKCPDGYTSMGDIAGSRFYNSDKFNFKCITSDCVEKIIDANKASNHAWMKYHKYKDGWGRDQYEFDFALNTLGTGYLYNNNWRSTGRDATKENAYNLYRFHKSDPFYKIKDTCLTVPVSALSDSTKDVEPDNADLGIGWNGHPYKLDPKYSIFTFMNLVPEGIIVNKGTGKRFYIIHSEGEDPNLYIILDYNKKTKKYDQAIQVDSNANNSNTKLRDKVISESRQQWKIILQSDKKLLTLKNVSNNKYLYIGLDPKQGYAQFSTIDLDNNNYKNNEVFKIMSQDDISNATQFSFISSFGTQLNVIDK